MIYHWYYTANTLWIHSVRPSISTFHGECGCEVKCLSIGRHFRCMASPLPHFKYFMCYLWLIKSKAVSSQCDAKHTSSFWVLHYCNINWSLIIQFINSLFWKFSLSTQRLNDYTISRVIRVEVSLWWTFILPEVIILPGVEYWSRSDFATVGIKYVPNCSDVKKRALLVSIRDLIHRRLLEEKRNSTMSRTAK